MKTSFLSKIASIVSVIFLLFFSVIFTSVFGQKTLFYRDIPDAAESILKIRYQIPRNFNFVDTLIGWRNSDSSGIGCFYVPVMQSDDKECMLMYALPVVVPKRFHRKFVATCDCPDKAFFRGRNLSHLNHIMLELSQMLGTRDFDRNDYVSVFTKDKAKKWFNADSVHIFDVSPVKPLYILDKKYIHCTRIYISKKNSPSSFITIGLFFTDDGKNRELEYLSKLEKNVWYKKGIIRTWHWRAYKRWTKLMRRDFCSSDN